VAYASIPNFKTYAEGESIPQVDPEDLKRRWNIKPPWTSQALQAAWSHEGDSSAVSNRDGMIRTLITHELLAPWQQGEEVDDAVFRIAATFPIRWFKRHDYMIEGDKLFGFDPNAFVQRLVEETGIAHTWEPIRTKIGEGGRGFAMCVLDGGDPDRQAKHQARELLWMIFKRFSPILDLVTSHNDGENAAHNAAVLFADFLMDNIDLVRQIEASFSAGTGGGRLDLLTELERRAQGGV
jgi:hypothetical protein